MADATTPAPANSAPKDWLVPATYFPLVFIYTMMKKGTDSNYLWHSKNGAGATVVSIALNIIFQVLWIVLGASMTFLALVFQLVNVAFGILMIYGAWQAWNGKLPTLPVITQIGQKIPLEKWFKGSATAQSAAAPVSAPVAPTAQSAAAPVPEPTPAPMPEPAAPVVTPTEPTPPTPPAPSAQA